ncbi:hypothetical protein, partial [Pseudomonas sp. KB_12]|uniref:hypothetical protein n=1 Tax=Pseudomonas sp. KB_12 TaxID=3233034 RepID=UPI003F9DF254
LKAVIVSLELCSARLQSWVSDWLRLKKALRTRGWILFDESLLPLGCAATVRFWGRFAAQWEQAPSPQKNLSRLMVVLLLIII